MKLIDQPTCYNHVGTRIKQRLLSKGAACASLPPSPPPPLCAARGTAMATGMGGSVLSSTVGNAGG